LLLCMPGTPFLYQGDELGLPQARVPFDRLRDPFALASWTQAAQDAGRDGARTPMPWATKATNGGFSDAAETWLPLDPRHLALAVDVQEADGGSMLHFTRRMLAMRKAHPALQTGEAVPVAAPDGVLAFERRLGRERLVCLFELAGRAASMEVPPGAELLTPEPVLAGSRVELPAFGAAILRLP